MALILIVRRKVSELNVLKPDYDKCVSIHTGGPVSICFENGQECKEEEQAKYLGPSKASLDPESSEKVAPRVRTFFVSFFFEIAVVHRSRSTTASQRLRTRLGSLESALCRAERLRHKSCRAISP